MTDLGFTGTRAGMTCAQIEIISRELDRLSSTELPQARHGMCIGSDFDFHNLCRSRHLFIIGHPGISRTGTSPTRANCICDLTLPPKYYSLRDHDIVETCHLLLATPSGFFEEFRSSGTWATIRYARRLKRPIMIVFPDGSIKEEGS